MKERCAVVIPIYKDELNPFELCSLRQAHKVLKAFPILYVAPEGFSLDKRIYGADAEHMVIRFNKDYFNGTLGYSALMLSEEFYKSFSDFEYILIYQLDAFVFSDRLMEFCEKDFDYIGAPCPQWLWNCVGIAGDGIGVVGNGGLSLRKVKKAIEIISIKERILLQRIDKEKILGAEDLFWGVCSEISFLDFHVADRFTAERFSIDQDFDSCYSRIAKDNLPFGCHGWWNCNFSFWRPYIESYGYSFTDEDIIKFSGSNMSEKNNRDYLNSYLLSCAQSENRFSNLKLISFPWSHKKLAVWGAGDVGKRTKRILEILGITDYVILNKSPVSNMNTIAPSIDVLSNASYFFILSSTKYENEMRKELVAAGRKEGSDFISYLDFSTELVRNIYPDEWNDFKLLDEWAGNAVSD